MEKLALWIDRKLGLVGKRELSVLPVPYEMPYCARRT